MAQWLNKDFFRNINLIFFPSKVLPLLKYDSIRDINLEHLLKLNISACILDVNQTIIPYDKNIIDKDIIEKLKELKSTFNCCILSNYIGSTIDDPNSSRTISIQKQLSFIPVVFTKHKKPSKEAFNDALKELKAESINCCVIGDRVFTDIVGANIMGMVSILVNPLNPNSDPFFYVAIPRIIERTFLKIFTYIKK